MENNKKTLGILFLILSGLLTINAFISLLSFWGVHLMGPAMHAIWNTLFYIVQTAVVLGMAFLPACRSGIVAKIGAGILAMLSLIALINILGVYITGKDIISIISVVFAMYLMAYISGGAMLAWGCRLWTPVKIAYTFMLLVSGILSVFSYILWHWYGVFDHKVMGLPILGTTGLVYFGTAASVLLLTVIWVAKNNPATAPRETSY